MPSGWRGVMATLMLSTTLQLLGGGDADGVDVVGIGGGDEEARRPGRRSPSAVSALPVAPDHVGGVRADAHAWPSRLPLSVSYWPSVPSAQLVTKNDLAVGMKQNAIGAAAGLDSARSPCRIAD